MKEDTYDREMKQSIRVEKELEGDVIFISSAWKWTDVVAAQVIYQFEHEQQF